MIKIDNISLSFESKTIFDCFSLTIEKGDKILIAGKSGRGKSTLLKVLMGYVDIESGNIIYNGQIIMGKAFNRIRHDFAYVNQDVSLENGKVIDVFEHIMSYKYNQLDKKGAIDQSLLEYFELEKEILQKDVTELSGGERQRLGLIIAIMLDRKIYLLDEVTSALDVDLKAKTVEYFAKFDKTVIVVSHDLGWNESNQFRKVEW